MTNEMVLERTSNLVMPSHYVEIDREEMSYVDGGWALWKTWAVIGGAFTILGGILGAAAAIVGTGAVATGLSIAAGVATVGAGVCAIMAAVSADD